MIINDLKYLAAVDDIIHHEEYLKLKNYWHHSSNIFDHCVQVSYKSYCVGEKLHLDSISLARGGLLHDFFLYEWRGDRFRIKDFKNSHAFRHPRIALNNAEKYFSINEIEKDIITKHMWPATIVPPRYKESLVVTMVDKYVAGHEYVYTKDNKSRCLLPHYPQYLI